MATTTIQDFLVKEIDEAYAMEQNVLRMLEGMIKTTDDPSIMKELEHHHKETEQQAERLKERLEAYGKEPSTMREIVGIAGALAKMPIDMMRPDKAARNLRDGFATEHLEIAAYELLERTAKSAGDGETAKVARENLREEKAMAEKISKHWDHVSELALEEEGISPSSM